MPGDNASGRLRVLTVKQPWADLIMAGVKDVENRTWPVPSTLPQWCSECGMFPCRGSCGECAWTPFPFRLWIHASKQPAAVHESVLDNWLEFCWREGVYEQYHLGVLLGSVTVTGCHADDCLQRTGDWHYHYVSGNPVPSSAYCSGWAEPDVYHWTLTDPRPLDVPIPMRGRQGLWTLPDIAVPA